MKWQQYPSASMSAEGKSSEYISMLNFMPFLPCALSTNEHKPDNAVNGRTDRQVDGWRDRGVACGIFLWHINLVQDKMWSEMKIERMYCIIKVSLLDTVILTLTYDLEVNQVRPLLLPMFQIWEKSIQGVLSHRINMITAGGGRSFNMKP